jgi:hypothetical protein
MNSFPEFFLLAKALTASAGNELLKEELIDTK